MLSTSSNNATLQNVKSFEHSTRVFSADARSKLADIATEPEPTTPRRIPPPAIIAVPPAIPRPPAAIEPPPTAARLALVNAAPDSPANEPPASTTAISGANVNASHPVATVITTVAPAPTNCLVVFPSRLFLFLEYTFLISDIFFSSRTACSEVKISFS